MILVTGATGTVGREVVQQLGAAAREPVRALVRDRHRAAQKLGAKVELVEGDLDQPATLAAALSGVDKVFYLPPDASKIDQTTAFVAAAKAAAVKHVVKLSVLGADVEPGGTIARWHREGEKQLIASGIPWTFVRPGGFMSNAFQWLGTIKSQGVFYQPAGEGKMAVIHPADIAEVAVAALTAPGHEGQAYTLTGPEALSFAEQAEKLGRAIGKPIKYVDVPRAAALDGMLKAGFPPLLAEAVLEFMDAVRAGHGALVTPDFEQVTGHKGRDFDSWARENAAAFR